MTDSISIVKFVKRDGPYNAGETAGFSEAVAARLVASGVAEHAPKGTSAPAAPRPAPPAGAGKEVTRTEDPPFVETDEGPEGEIEVRDARADKDKMVRTPQRRK